MLCLLRRIVHQPARRPNNNRTKGKCQINFTHRPRRFGFFACQIPHATIVLCGNLLWGFPDSRRPENSKLHIIPKSASGDSNSSVVCQPGTKWLQNFAETANLNCEKWPIRGGRSASESTSISVPATRTTTTVGTLPVV